MDGPASRVDAQREPRRFTDRALLRRCVHCGFCLPVCPTYLELGTETDSPRGRIMLIRGLEEGSVALSADVVRHLDRCLGCRACESACPSGVPYGELIEDTRAFIEQRYERPLAHRAWRRTLLGVVSHHGRLRAALAPVRMLRRAGLGRMLRSLPYGSAIPESDGAPAPAGWYHPREKPRARVGLLGGCVSAALFGETTRAAIRVLNRNGVSVFVPGEPHCCGALHVHAGAPREGRAAARQVMGLFPAELDAVLSTSAGCGAAMKEYGRLLKNEPGDRAPAFAARVRDICEYLVELCPVAPAGQLRLRVACHDPCHLAHAQGIREAPRLLLSLIPGLEMVPLAESDLCCGAAGSYHLTQPEMAGRLLERKTARIAGSGADCVVAANPGCVLHIRSGLRKRGLRARVVHPIELLDQAYGRGT